MPNYLIMSPGVTIKNKGNNAFELGFTSQNEIQYQGITIKAKNREAITTRNKINIDALLDTISTQAALDQALHFEPKKFLQIAKSYQELTYKEYPALNNYSPIIPELSRRNVSIEDILLSRTYSGNPDMTKKKISFVSNFFDQQGQLFKDVFAAVCLGIAKGKHFPVAPMQGEDPRSAATLIPGSILSIEQLHPLKIVHRIDNADQLDSSNSGDYMPWHNVVVFTSNDVFASKYANDRYDSSILVHELAHAAANILFLNNMNPYFVEQENIYAKALRELSINLCKMLKCDIKISAKDSYFSIMPKILTSPALAFAVIIKSRTAVEALETFHSQHQEQTRPSIEKIYNKYFPNKAPSELTNEDIVFVAKQEIGYLQLSEEALNIIRLIHTMNLSYAHEKIACEIFAAMLQYNYFHGNDPVVKDFFAPIEQAVSGPIHELVQNQLIIPHQLECTGQVDTHDFDHCVKELLS